MQMPFLATVDMGAGGSGALSRCGLDQGEGYRNASKTSSA